MVPNHPSSMNPEGGSPPKDPSAHGCGPSPCYEELRARFEDIGQGQVFRFHDRLDPHGQTEFLACLDSIDTASLPAFQKALHDLDREPATSTIEPVEMLELESSDYPYRLHPRARNAAATGDQLLREGKVAALALAGGQGTRLGVDHPKGLYPIFPLSDRTLFEGFASQLQGLMGRYGATPPLWVMTSRKTHLPTREYFEENEFLGLDEGSVYFFQQGENVVLSPDGDLFLESPVSLATSPDGHGGCVGALKNSGGLAKMESQGIEWVFVFQVDNPALKLCDPSFIGLAAESECEVAFKTVRKLDPTERVGVLARRDGRHAIVEYSELTGRQAGLRRTDGSLAFNAGNTAIYLFRLSFLKRATRQLDLPYHPALKVCPYCDESGRTVTPSSPNGYKFERFIFDLFEHAAGLEALEIAREEEFLPVKSATGEDSPERVRRSLQAYWRAVLRGQGVAVDDGQAVEIAPGLLTDRDRLSSLIESRRAEFERIVSDPAQELRLDIS